jgi:hypothetical protein
MGELEGMMRGLRAIALLVGAAVGGLGLAVPSAAQAQEAGAQAAPSAAPADFTPPRATAYQGLTQLPDWSGIWYPDWTLLFGGRSAARPALTPAAQAKFDAYTESIRENGPNQEAQAQCLPPGIPGIIQQPYPIEILFSPGQVTMLHEAYAQVRRFYTDGRPLPEEPDLFFNGNSIGRWDGDTLVVETVGLHPSTFITAGVNHSEQARVVERIYLQAPGQLVDEITITDPEVLTAPFQTKVAFRLDNSFPIREYVCSENNRLVSGENGANIDLGLEEEGSEEDPFAGTE